MDLRARLLGAALTVEAATLGVGGVAMAQALPCPADQHVTKLSEVVVTARKREESLQSVPLAVTSLSGTQLERQRILQPTDLGWVVPSLQIRSGASDNGAFITMRGQAAANSVLGVSQPVSLYEDAVNIPHPVGANNAFFDLQRVEVLKGPQGTLYGRNTTGGAINIITRNADHDAVHGFIEVEGGDYGDWRVGAAVNIPVVADSLALRLAYQHWSRDGFGQSIVTGQRYGEDRNDDIARLSVRLDPATAFTGTLKVEWGQAKHTAAMTSARSVLDPAKFPPELVAAVQGTLRQTYIDAALWKNAALYAPMLATSPGAVIAAGAQVLAPCIGQSIYQNCSATDQFDNLETWHGVLDWSWDIAPRVRLRSITGLHKFSNTRVIDVDAVQPQILEVGFGSDGLAIAPTVGQFALPFSLPPEQESRQWTQEFNLTGEAFDNRLGWLVGAYGSWDRGAGATQAGQIEEFAAVALGGATVSGHTFLLNTSETWALFSQNDVKFNDVFSITLGARYTEEMIGQDLAFWSYNVATNTLTCFGALPDATQVKFAPADPHDFTSCARDIRATGPNDLFTRAKSNGISYLLSFNVQLGPDKLLYVKTARGFRGGSFGSVAQPPAHPETAVDYEFGLKASWFDRRLRTDLAAYWTNYDNKQVLSVVCEGGGRPPCPRSFATLLLNAAQARMRGVELEFQAAPIRDVLIYGSFAYNDATYTDFPFPDNTTRNLAGQPLLAMPNSQGAIGARYEHALLRGVGSAQLDYNFRGELPLFSTFDVPDALRRDMNRPAGIVNLRLEYRRDDLGVTGAAWVTNLTDEAYGYEGVAAIFTNGISHMQVLAPRMWGVTLRKTFGRD
jgi:iron complex outermembrane receptor protein